MMPLSFRRLQPTDSAAYREIRLACLHEYPNHFGADHAQQAALPKLWMEEQIQSGNEEAFCIGAFQEAQLIGICALHRNALPARRHSADILQMYIQTQYQGKGIGHQLLQATLQAAWEILELEQLNLEVVTSAGAALHLYSAAGFEQCGFNKNAFKRVQRYEDTYTMVLFRPHHVLPSEMKALPNE